MDGKIEWVGEINSEPGFIDVELGTMIEESSLELGDTWDGNR